MAHVLAFIYRRILISGVLEVDEAHQFTSDGLCRVGEYRSPLVGAKIVYVVAE